MARRGVMLVMVFAGLVSVAPAVANAAAGWSTAPGFRHQDFDGVSCSAVDSCELSGNRNVTSGNNLLLAHWNGSKLAIQPAPLPADARPASDATLWRISCSSALACTAVGSYMSHRYRREVPLIEHWAGRRWEPQSSPDPRRAGLPAGSSRDSVLTDVSCPSVDACVAVGAYGSNSGFEGFPFSERWNGSRWTLARARLPAGAPDGELASISCTSGNACTAVGDSLGTLAEQWNGTHWSIAALPAGGTAGGLVGVSCPSARTCEAVGSSPFNTVSDQPLTARYAAGAWTAQPITPLVGSAETELLGLSCRSGVACVALGQERSARTGDLFNVYATWDGSRWTIAPFLPALSADHGPLFAISCATASHCLAVGSRIAERLG